MHHNIIFTDLDGTLLDAASYSHAGALPALSWVEASGIPLILCSSKTRAELEVYRVRLHNSHPFIAENGGAIYIPPGYFSFEFNSIKSNGYNLILLGLPYAEIRQQFVRLREQSGARVRGFADMSAAEVAALTGLTAEEATLARQRDFDEAFVFDGDTDENFLFAIESAGLHWTQGRMFHLLGNHDKGRAVEILLSLYRRQFGMVASIGLGDSLNDLPMLRAVDRAVLVRHADDSFDTRIDLPGMVKTRLAGPAGWNESVLQWLAQQDEAQPDRQTLLAIFNAALAAADPYNAVLKAVRFEQKQLQIAGAVYPLDAYARIVVVGAGKATARMALAVETLLGDRIDAGLIIVKDGHTEPLSVIEQVESSHPVPAAAGVAGTRRVLEMLHAAGDKTLVICLLSGGASALLVSPVAGIELQDKQETTRLLLNAGASIGELNAVRKHLSAVKGGRLAQAAYPAQLITLIVSDVIGDPLDVIASGPTAPDSSSFADAWAVLLKYGLQQKLPARVAEYLQRGMAGGAEETVKENNPCMNKTRNVIIAGIHQALAAAQQQCGLLGLASRIISDSLQGEARDAARLLAQAARAELAAMQAHERRCLLCGGETTVRVSGGGKGGRNQELALAFAVETAGLPGVSQLSAGTDGTDGPTDAAGAMVDGSTAARARKLGLEPLGYLDNNDSYTFFQKYDAATGGSSHLKTGPTGTNVMDIQIVLLSKDGTLIDTG
ncbi:MAG TPA: HAD-IIB family hydrolase [Gallionellaceae bacterium]|nr:HAD-IIB family hydrolase [Gallionellaceae bacterium]